MGLGQVVVEFLSGGVGGVACVLGGQPLDTVKVKLQAFPGTTRLRTTAYGQLTATEVSPRSTRDPRPLSWRVWLRTRSCWPRTTRVWTLSGGFVERRSPNTYLCSCAHAPVRAPGSVASVPATFTCAPVGRSKSVMQVQRELSTGHLVRHRRCAYFTVVLCF